MKANDLKATGLMVGDWVLLKGTPAKIGGVEIYGSTLYVHTNLTDSWCVSGFQPIPLTPEILEKNGFYCDRNDGYAILKLEDNSLLLYYFHEYKLTKFYKGEVIAKCQCVYVHELQHALKLFGIDKKIVV